MKWKASGNEMVKGELNLALTIIFCISFEFSYLKSRAL